MKECKVAITGGGTLEIGEECCPGAAYPTPYKEIKIDLKANATFEAYLPPPFSAFGLVWFNARTPGWFGDPYQLFAGRLQWAVGVYGGGSAELSIFSDKFRIGECGNCLTLAITATPKGTLGIAGNLNCKVWFGTAIAGDPSFETNVDLSVSVNVEVKLEGNLKVGSPTSTCKGFGGKVCWGETNLELKALFAVTGFGSYNYTKVIGPYIGKCVDF